MSEFSPNDLRLLRNFLNTLSDTTVEDAINLGGTIAAPEGFENEDIARVAKLSEFTFDSIVDGLREDYETTVEEELERTNSAVGSAFDGDHDALAAIVSELRAIVGGGSNE